MAVLAKTADAQNATPSAAAPDSPSPHPTKQPSTGKPPSAAAVAMAATFRSFDPALSDDQLHQIAQNIDDNRAAGAQLNPRKKPLKNSDEPVARFSATEHLAG
ncbi:MAG: hypothetical protein NVSMB64_24340 [Candidatus Velthaea sp.]